MENPAEVQELRNKLRMMKFPQDDILNTVRRQQRAIHKQKEANETIRSEIEQYESEIESFNKRDQQYKSSEQRINIESKRKNLTNRLGILMADFKAEDEKRRKLEEDVSKARSRSGGLFAQARENEEILSRLHTMENRLETAYNNYNKHLKKLDALRTEIDELRKERFTFNQVYAHAIADEKAKDEQISELINQSNESYALRDQLKMEIVDLKNAEKEHQQKFEQEINRFTQMIEGQALLNHHPRNDQQPIPSMSSQSGSNNDQNETLQKETDMMSNIVEQTLKLTETSKLDELFELYNNLEQENYSLFSFVMENGSEKANLVDRVEKLRERSNELTAESEMSEEEQNLQLQKLTEEMEETEKNLKYFKEIKENNDEEIKETYKAIEDVYNEIGCSWENVPDEKEHVTSQNVLYCLSEIENHFAEIMNQVSMKASVIQISSLKEKSTSLASAEEKSIHSFSRLPGISRAELPVTPTKGSERPLTPAELRARLGILSNC